MSLLLLLNDQVAPDAAQTMPTLRVLLETSPGTMVDVSADYQLATTFRGRNRELDLFQAGTAIVQLQDLSRKYDPANTAGPYYPHLKPMRGLQITGTWNGTTYPVFTGTVDSIESVYAGPPSGDAKTTLYATDGFKALEAATLASSVYYQEVLADDPAHWWHLGEPVGSTVFFDAVADDDLTVIGSPTLSSNGLISREDGDSFTITGDNQGAQRRGPATTAGPPFTIELVISSSGFGAYPAVEVNDIATVGWTLRKYILDSDLMSALVILPSGAFLELVTTSQYTDRTSHVALTWASDGRMCLYLNGVMEASGTLTPETWPSTTVLQLGGGAIGSSIVQGLWGAYQEFAVYDAALPADRIAAHAAAVTTPWNNDTPGERIARVLDAAGWPGAARELDEGTSTLQSAELDTTALDHAQKAAASDFGVLFIRADGAVRFIGRAGLFNQPQLATFGDGGGAELGYVSLRPELTDQLIRNDVTVSRLEGVAQTVRDEDSIDEFLRHTYTADGLLHDNDDLSRSAAQFLVSEYKDPRRRISNMIVAPRGAPSTLFPQVLGLELQDQITVLDRPPGGGSANSQDTSIEGIAHTITPLWWETSWNLAPSFGAQGTPGNVWALGVAGFGELGDTTRLGF